MNRKRMFWGAAVLAFYAGSSNGSARNHNAIGAAHAQALDSYGKLPLSFVWNAGQIDHRVQFTSNGKGFSLFLTRGGGATLSLRRNSGRSVGHAASIVQMQFAGANPNTSANGIDQLPGRFNYFVGPDPAGWRTNVPTYSRVRYPDVYPGIDVVYYGNQRNLEYDFVIAPKADPAAIRLQIVGADSQMDPRTGDLVLMLSSGDIRFHSPIAYQQAGNSRHNVAVSYALEKDGITFSVGPYDHTQPLVVDPVLGYGTLLGGSSDDRVTSMAVDSTGALYLTGDTASYDFPVVNPFQTYDDVSDQVQFAYVTKLNAAGSALLYSTYFGGRNNGDPDATTGYAIAIDSSGNAYVGGGTSSNTLPVTSSAYQKTFRGGTCESYEASCDGFLAKFDSTGAHLVYATYLGGSADDQITGIALDNSNRAHVVGTTYSTNFPASSGAYQRACAGSYCQDIFVSTFSADGSSLLYSTYLGGQYDEYGNGIAVDSNGNSYITGITDSFDFPVTSSAFGKNVALTDAFISKLDPTLSNLTYSTILGGEGYDQGRGIAVDSYDNIYVTGFTRSPDFPVTANGYDRACGDDGYCDNSAGNPSDAFVSKIDPSGSLVYSTFLGGNGEDTGNTIAVDYAGHIWVAGYASSADFPTLGGFLTSCTGDAGCSDAFAAEIDPSKSGSSSLVYSTFIGGTDGANEANAITVDRFGNAYVGGYTLSDNFFPVTKGAYQTYFAGGSALWGDAFIIKIDQVYHLTTSVSPAGSGTVSANPSSSNGNYVGGLKVCVTATPASGYKFSSWSGAPLDSSSCLVMNSNHSVTANFTKTTGTITATGGTPQTANTGAVFAAALQATVKDANGSPVSGASVTFAAPTSGATATLSAKTAVTNSSGVASVTAAANSATGTYSITATVVGVNTAATFRLTNQTGVPASIVTTAGTPQTANTATVFAAALKAEVKDSKGLPVSGVKVTFTPPSSGASATLSAKTVLTNSSGLASVTATANSTTGTYAVKGSVSALSTAATFTLTNQTGVPASIKATGGTPQTANRGTAFATPLQATVKDAKGLAVEGVTVTFVAPSSGASAKLSSKTAITNSTGAASVTATANSTAGSYSVTAAVSAVSNPAAFALTNQ